MFNQITGETIQYVQMIIGFVTGGGVMMFANWRLTKRSAKLDFADKAIAFMEKNNDGLMRRVITLEAEVKNISKLKCERVLCPDRVQQS